MLTHLCTKREVQYVQQENDLKQEREDLINRGFVAQNQLSANQLGYKKKLEAMTKIYKNVIDVRQINQSYGYLNVGKLSVIFKMLIKPINVG